MKTNQYMENQYLLKKSMCRMRLGAYQFLQKPWLNIIWLIFVLGMVWLNIVKNKLLVKLDISEFLLPVLKGGLEASVMVIGIFSVVLILKGLGEVVAKKEESLMVLVFSEMDLTNREPILVSKKKLKKQGVIVREFFTVIPMSKWQQKKDAICDIFNVHLVEDIKYGKSNGNRIVIKSAKGRQLKDRGSIYDEIIE